VVKHFRNKKEEKVMATKNKTQLGIKYLDIQAYVGVTKHNGGFEATDELLSLCHIKEAQEVLNVGCGIGVGPAYIARKHGCRVVGVDISEKMIEWSRRRAREKRVEDKVEFRVANVLDLPFEADRFDVVLCESVLVFVEDKPQAIRECVRVTRPGGYVGLNETFWLDDAPSELTARAQATVGVGTDIPTISAWQALWAEAGFRDQVVRAYQLDPRAEIKSRIRWIGWRWMLKAWARALRLYVTNPAGRQLIKEMFDTPLVVIQQMGYGLFVGKK
jgi:arsenite methyltransferase